MLPRDEDDLYHESYYPDDADIFGDAWLYDGLDDDDFDWDEFNELEIEWEWEQ